jgi:hypothetical protein
MLGMLGDEASANLMTKHLGMLRVLASHKALEHPQLLAHVHNGDGTGLLAALQIAIGTIASAQPKFDRQQITPGQRRALRCQTHSSSLWRLNSLLLYVPMAVGVQVYVTRDTCTTFVQEALVTAAVADSSWRQRLFRGNIYCSTPAHLAAAANFRDGSLNPCSRCKRFRTSSSLPSG